MLGTRMQSIYEEDALPTLLGSRKQRQFLHDKVNAFGMPREWEAQMPGGITLAEMKASKQAVPEPLSPVAKKKQPKAKPQPSAAEHPQARTGMNHLRDEWPTSASAVGTAWVTEKAQKELMAAVARNDAKRTEELLSKFGPSLKLGSNWPLSDKVFKLLLAQGEAPFLKQGRDTKKGGLVKHAGKELLGKTFKDGHKQFCLDEDLTKLNAKENQTAARLGRSASVPHLPHIGATTSYPISVPRRSVSNTRIRRKPIYQSDA
jgi:hypothetical protein